MDPYGAPATGQKAHRVEIYTAALLIQGTLYGAFDSTADLINRWDQSNLILQEVTLSPIGQGSRPKRIAEPFFVPRSQVHFLTAAPTPEETAEHTAPEAPPNLLRSRLAGGDKPTPFREGRMQRAARSSYVYTSVFTISGLCHLLEGNTVENILDAQAVFFTITKATINLNLYPDSPWPSGLVLVNKALVQGMYIVEPRSQ